MTPDEHTRLASCALIAAGIIVLAVVYLAAQWLMR